MAALEEGRGTDLWVMLALCSTCSARSSCSRRLLMTKWPPGLCRIWSHQGLALMMEKATSPWGLQARPGRIQIVFREEGLLGCM